MKASPYGLAPFRYNEPVEMTKERQIRLPKTTRAKQAPNFRLVDRDFLLLKALVEYRFLLLAQFEKLFPETSIRGIARRLKLLYHGGYVERLSLDKAKLSPQMIYAMTDKGAEALAEHEEVERSEIAWQRHLNRVGPSHIQHLLAINDLLIAFRKELGAAAKAGQVKDFAVLRGDKGQHRLETHVRDQKGHRQTVSVIPDLVLAVMFSTGDYGIFFVEIDRSTMRGQQWNDKVAIYREVIRSAELKAKYRTGWFIVLTVTTGVKRERTLLKKTVESRGRRAFWFTTMDRLEAEGVFGSVWLRATDMIESGPEGLASVDRHSVLDALG